MKIWPKWIKSRSDGMIYSALFINLNLSKLKNSLQVRIPCFNFIYECQNACRKGDGKTDISLIKNRFIKKKGCIEMKIWPKWIKSRSDGIIYSAFIRNNLGNNKLNLSKLKNGLQVRIPCFTFIYECQNACRKGDGKTDLSPIKNRFIKKNKIRVHRNEDMTQMNQIEKRWNHLFSVH